MVTLLSNKITKDEVKPGDHIYSWRRGYLYSHHGIYVGDEKVIHFTRSADHETGTGTWLDNIIYSSSPARTSTDPCPRCGDQSTAAGVISSCLDCFLCGGDLYQFQYDVAAHVFLFRIRGGTCTLAKPDPPEDVIHRAKFLLENGFGLYNIFHNNCEDFTIYCKTGLLIVDSGRVGRSGQATSFIAATTAVASSPLRLLTTSYPGLAVVGCTVYCVSRYIADIGVRTDVIKVSVERLVSHPGVTEAEEESVERLVSHPGVTEAEEEAAAASVTAKQD